MADKKAFLLRIDAGVLEAMQRWAGDDLRSVNAQIEFVLRRALQSAGRAPTPADASRRGPEPRDAAPGDRGEEPGRGRRSKSGG